MKMLELFSGTGRMAQAFNRRGWTVATVDKYHIAQSRTDIHDLTKEEIVEMLNGEPNVIWASPPCNAFSVAVVSRNWIKNENGFTPKSDSAREGIALLKRTLDILSMFPNATFYIENPRGMMRKMPEMERFKRQTATYCQYGESRMKPTDIWSNSDWVAKPICRNGDPCHESAPRGSRTGTQGIKGSYYRSALPEQLCDDIAEHETKRFNR